MFAFALWDEAEGALYCARDRFGIKPFYWTADGDLFHFASEAKALLPFLDDVETDLEGLKDYLAFQFCLEGKTLFKGVRELPAGHLLRVAAGQVQVRRYWEVYYDLDFDHTAKYFEERTEELLAESVRLHLRSDVPVAAYLSGGLDSSSVASLAGRPGMQAFTGRFPEDGRYDESEYAKALADQRGLDLHLVDIGADDFLGSIDHYAYRLPSAPATAPADVGAPATPPSQAAVTDAGPGTLEVASAN